LRHLAETADRSRAAEFLWLARELWDSTADVIFNRHGPLQEGHLRSAA
jgi:hypothetical protein